MVAIFAAEVQNILSGVSFKQLIVHSLNISSFFDQAILLSIIANVVQSNFVLILSLRPNQLTYHV